MTDSEVLQSAAAILQKRTLVLTRQRHKAAKLQSGDPVANAVLDAADTLLWCEIERLNQIASSLEELAT